MQWFSLISTYQMRQGGERQTIRSLHPGHDPAIQSCRDRSGWPPQERPWRGTRSAMRASRHEHPPHRRRAGGSMRWLGRFRPVRSWRSSIARRAIRASTQVARIVALDVTDHGAVVGFLQANEIGLVVVGPEAPLVAGLADDLRGHGIKVFGPSKLRRPAGGLEGLHQGLCDETRYSDRRLWPFSRTGGRHCLCGAARRADRHQGRRAGGRQGRHRGHDQGRGHGRASRTIFSGRFGAPPNA